MAEAPVCTYRLLGPDGFYESRTPGTLGGNGNDRIYGRLDCGTALASIRRYPGAYASHRVLRRRGNRDRIRLSAVRELHARAVPGVEGRPRRAD